MLQNAPRTVDSVGMRDIEPISSAGRVLRLRRADTYVFGVPRSFLATQLMEPSPLHDLNLNASNLAHQLKELIIELHDVERYPQDLTGDPIDMDDAKGLKIAYWRSILKELRGLETLQLKNAEIVDVRDVACFASELLQDMTMPTVHTLCLHGWTISLSLVRDNLKTIFPELRSLRLDKMKLHRQSKDKREWALKESGSKYGEQVTIRIDRATHVYANRWIGPFIQMAKQAGVEMVLESL